MIHTTFGMTAAARKLRSKRPPRFPPGTSCCSPAHAHTGPVLAEPGAYAAATGGDNKAGEGLHGPNCRRGSPRRWRRRTPRRSRRRRSAASARKTPLAFNRRFHMTDGTVGWNPGKLNPKILKPAGPVDPSVPVVQFVTADKEREGDRHLRELRHALGHRRRAALLGGLHRRVWPTRLAKVHGEQAVTVFGLGCCGDVNHINVNFGQTAEGARGGLPHRHAAGRRGAAGAATPLQPVGGRPARGVECHGRVWNCRR